MPKPPRKSQKGSTSRSGKIEPPERRSRLAAILKGLLGIGMILGTVIVIGSYFIREEVIRRVRGREVAAGSAVYGRPFPIELGMDTKKSKLKERLERLSYRSVASVPESPGEYRAERERVTIYLRGTQSGPQIDQPPQLVELRLNAQGQLESILDAKFRGPLGTCYLEPEMLSLLGSSASRSSIPKTLKDFPENLKHAVLAIEDERFYSHFGVDPVAIFRAIAVNVSSGQLRQGGSTITQQLAKNLLFTQERTLVRKILEALSATLIESAFTKDQIFELYLNEVFLGQEGNVAMHGFGEAARSFFDKDVADISLEEAATLAAIIKAPTKLSPRLYPKNAKARRIVVLEKMHELGFISETDKQQAMVANIHVRPAERTKRNAPYFVDYTRRFVSNTFDLSNFERLKLRIVTGLDMLYQECAEKAVEQGLKRLEQSYPALRKHSKPLQTALIAVNPVHGEIRAWVGGRDYAEYQFDRISQSKRQPGSAFKPFVYLTALDSSLNQYRVARTTSILSDEPISLPIPGGKTWQPKNYDEEYHGDVTVREALARSLNIPTVLLALKVGIEAVAATAARFGFGEDLPQVPSLALGAGEVSPFDMARAYGALANGGLMVQLRPILSVMIDGDSRPAYQAERLEERVSTEPAVYVLTDLLRGVIDGGTGRVIRSLGFAAPAAGKTGTSNDSRDAWFAGYTPRLLAVVWVGFDDNKELKLTGGQAAAPIWAEFMKCAAPLEPQLDFVPPPGVVFRDVDITSGLLYTSLCDPRNRRSEIFVEGTEPVTECQEAAAQFPDAPPPPGHSEFTDEFDRSTSPGGLPPARGFVEHDPRDSRRPRGMERRGMEVVNPPSTPGRSFWENVWN